MELIKKYERHQSLNPLIQLEPGSEVLQVLSQVENDAITTAFLHEQCLGECGGAFVVSDCWAPNRAVTRVNYIWGKIGYLIYEFNIHNQFCLGFWYILRTSTANNPKNLYLHIFSKYIFTTCLPVKKCNLTRTQKIFSAMDLNNDGNVRGPNGRGGGFVPRGWVCWWGLGGTPWAWHFSKSSSTISFWQSLITLYLSWFDDYHNQDNCFLIHTVSTCNFIHLYVICITRQYCKESMQTMEFEAQPE